MRRMRDLVAGIRRVRQRRRVLMMRRRRRVAVMMMGRRVHVTVTMTHGMGMVWPGCTVHVVQQIVVGRQRVVVQVQDIRQERLATPLGKFQIGVGLART